MPGAIAGEAYAEEAYAEPIGCTRGVFDSSGNPIQLLPYLVSLSATNLKSELG